MLTSACGEGTTTPPEGTPEPEATTLVLVRDTATLTWLGETVHLEATVVDQFDQPLTDEPVTWRSTAAAVASVSTTGQVTALSNGTGSIVASAGTASDTALVTVSQLADTIATSISDATLEWIDETVQVEIEVWDLGGAPISIPDASWETSDESVAVVSSRGLIVARGPGEATVTVASGRAQANVSVSVIGKSVLILYTSYRDGDFDIYVMDEDGSAETNLTAAPTSTEIEPAASPDGSRIAYASDQAGPGWDIYTMLPDGSDVQNLSNSPDHTDLDPTWSPDGQKIAFVRGADSLYVMDSDGGNPQWLGILGRDPSWSPDGSRLAYTSSNSLHVADADGSNPTDISLAGWQDLQPSWSPDGTTIVYSSRPSLDDDFEIHAVAPDGSGRIQLTNDPYDYHDQYPAWSPRGHRIVFNSGLGSVSDIWTMAPDGSALLRITSDSNRPSDTGWLLVPPP